MESKTVLRDDLRCKCGAKSWGITWHDHARTTYYRCGTDAHGAHSFERSCECLARLDAARKTG